MSNLLGIYFPFKKRGHLESGHDLLSAEVNIGRHIESVKASASTWSMEDYEEHWEKSLLALIRTERIINFCSSLDGRSADVWVARRYGHSIIVVNLIIRRKDIVIDGLALSSRKIEELFPILLQDESASKWKIQMDGAE